MSVTKRSVMTLYSDSSIGSHRIRLILAEKAISVDVIALDHNAIPESLSEINPTNNLPTILDRDLVLYDEHVIIEYLDERFPHPPIFPAYPVARAKSRMMVYRIERDWYSYAAIIEAAPSTVKVNQAKKAFTESLVTVAPLFAESKFFLSDDYTVVDACLAPLLWRLKHYGIQLPRSAAAIETYAQRLFEKPTFQASLSEDELFMSVMDDVK